MGFSTSVVSHLKPQITSVVSIPRRDFWVFQRNRSNMVIIQSTKSFNP
ncbi:hypothetical protein CKA32_000665 [Geitlerinema sp. FC II]|nr:hypothetical protein CKA32_000665 [Geitlerinema sp. FC II]